MNGQDGIYAPDECACDDPMGLMVCRVHPERECVACCGTGFSTGVYANTGRLPANAFRCEACKGTGKGPSDGS